MSIKQTLVEGALKAIGLLHPELAPLLGIIVKYEPEIERLMPVLKQAVAEGPGAFAAAQKAAPDLAAAIKNFVDPIPLPAQVVTKNPHHVHAARLENVTRQIIGLDKMSPDEETKWIDSKSPPQDSRFGG